MDRHMIYVDVECVKEAVRNLNYEIDIQVQLKSVTNNGSNLTRVFHYHCVACGSYSPGMFLNNQSPAARLCYPAPIYITILRLCYSRYVKSTDFTITIPILYYTIL